MLSLMTMQALLLMGTWMLHGCEAHWEWLDQGRARCAASTPTMVVRLQSKAQRLKEARKWLSQPPPSSSNSNSFCENRRNTGDSNNSKLSRRRRRAGNVNMNNSCKNKHKLKPQRQQLHRQQLSPRRTVRASRLCRISSGATEVACKTTRTLFSSKAE